MEAKWRNWNISNIFFSLSSIEGRKQRRGQEYLHYVWEQWNRREHSKKIVFSFWGGSFCISDTPCSGRPLGFDEDSLNTLNHNGPRQCTRELGNVKNCDHSTIVWHLHSMGKVQKSGVWVPHALSQNHKNQLWPYVHLCLLVINWLVNNSDHSYPASLLVMRNGVFMLTQGNIRNGWALTKKHFPVIVQRHPQKIMLYRRVRGITNCFPEV